MVKVSDIIVQYLKANNIEIVFGIIGSANSHIFNSILEEGSIKLVSVHHEQAAVMAELSISDFMDTLFAYNISIFNYSASELKSDINNAEESIS